MKLIDFLDLYVIKRKITLNTEEFIDCSNIHKNLLIR